MPHLDQEAPSSSVIAIEQMAQAVEEMVALMREGRGGSWKAHQKTAIESVLARSPELPGRPAQIRKALLERLRIRRTTRGPSGPLTGPARRA